MNKRISQVAIVSLVLLASLILATTYWQTWASAGLAARQDNDIQRVAQFTIDRGLIVASNGKTILAKNVKKKVNGQTLYFRTYPTHGLASQVVGYSTQSRARSGLESSQNSYLTASNADLSHDLRHRRRPAQGNDGEGERPRADDPPGRPVARPASARGRSAARPS